MRSCVRLLNGKPPRVCSEYSYAVNILRPLFWVSIMQSLSYKAKGILRDEIIESYTDALCTAVVKLTAPSFRNSPIK